MGADGRPSAALARRLDEYVDAVAAEWRREAAAHRVRRLHTLYLGGGTPSLLGAQRLRRLLAPFRGLLTPGAEVTVETNPEDVDDEYAAWAAAPSGRRAGTSADENAGPSAEEDADARPFAAPARRGLRISLGVQSFSADLRAALGRTACADPRAAFLRLRRAGVVNLGVDLIHGIPGQSAAQLDADLQTVRELRPDHVSWYELDVVEGTALARRLVAPAAGVAAASVSDVASADSGAAADRRAATFRRVVRELSRAGYDWYEVSSFALPGKKARHNVAGWRAHPYLGLGPGAVSTVGARRWTNAADPAAWAAALAAGAAPPRTEEALTSETAARERLFLAARSGGAVPLAAVDAVVDSAVLAQLIGAGLATVRGGTLRVTRKGRHVADELCVRLFRDSCLREHVCHSPHARNRSSGPSSRSSSR